MNHPALLAVVLLAGPCFAADRPLIFPPPRTLTVAERGFALTGAETIALPANPSGDDLSLARALQDDLGDRFGIHLKAEPVAELSAPRRTILIGSLANPLVKGYCAQHGIDITADKPGPEGYVLRVLPDFVLVAGSDDRGTFYGVQSLRQIAGRDSSGALRFQGVDVRDWPDKPYRGIKLYLPGRANIPFFKRFVRDFMALYKFNTLIVEMNGNMRLRSHPEVNSALVAFARDENFSRKNYAAGAVHGRHSNSTHYDTADGEILEQSEVADLAGWVKASRIELVPELPSFTHSFYLLAAHPELAEVPGEKWPDVYCPSNSKSYELLFDIYDEYIDVLKPKTIHAGHDELFIPVGLCPRCGKKDVGERFGEDVRKIHDHLAAKGIRMAIWGDMLLQDVRGAGLTAQKFPDGTSYSSAGGMTPEQVARLIPKDVLLYNWFWGDWSPRKDLEGQLDRMGFQQVWGNFTAKMRRYAERRGLAGILGGAPSAWFATNEIGFGKELMPDFLSAASLFWSGREAYGKELSALVQSMLPEIRVRLRGLEPPSWTEKSFAPVRLNASGSSPAVLGRARFEVAREAVAVGTDGKDASALPKQAPPIAIGADATSLIFLHASIKPAYNREGFRVIWDQEDTADLLGWYEVVYEDGFVTTIPVRYGVNIQEANWDERTAQRDYCYGADAVGLGGGVTYFAYEWTNPRLGKVIKEIRLKGTTGFRGAPAGFTDDYGPVIPGNGILLKAITVVKKR
jgi:hypothetical protein